MLVFRKTFNRGISLRSLFGGLLKERVSEIRSQDSHTMANNNTSSPKMKRSEKTKKQRAFDFSKYNTRKVAFKLAYLGWDYQGFAGQVNTEKTIETELFAALTKSFLIKDRESSNYSRCGRTDKGVSALGQVISLDVRSNLLEGDGVIQSGDQDKVKQRSGSSEVSEIPYVFILNKLLPAEIRMIAWTPVCTDFSARFSCLHRVYKYFFPVAGMDTNLMNEAGQRFIGQHDFRNFCKMDISGGVTNFERTLTAVEVTKLPHTSGLGFEMGVVTIRGLAFLWHQVRCLVAVLFLIGQKLENPEIIDQLLDIENNPRRPQYTMASELPLVLFDCAFENITWIHDSEAVDEIQTHFQKMWALQNTRTVMIQSFIDHIKEVPIATTDNQPITWQELNPNHNAIQAATLIPGHMSSKKYRKLQERSLCVSFEDKYENFQAKKRKTETDKDVPPDVSTANQDS